MVWVTVLIDGEIEAVNGFVLGENLPERVVEVLVAKLIASDGGTEFFFDTVGTICSLDGSDLVGNNDFGVDELPAIDIERTVVGTEPYIVLDELKVTVEDADLRL